MSAIYTTLTFGMELPAGANLSAFADELTALVERYGGNVGGGPTGSISHAEDPEDVRYSVTEFVTVSRPAPELKPAHLVSAMEAATMTGLSHAGVIQIAQREHWTQVVDGQEPNPRRARRYLRSDVLKLRKALSPRHVNSVMSRRRPATRA